jgi:polyphenol oxidase
LIEQQLGGVRYLQFSHYRHFPGLAHGIFTRQGGCSQAPYASLNTSTPPFKQGDSIDNVIRNRVHGADIAIYDAGSAWRTDWANHSYYERAWTPEYIHKADALITRERGVVIALSFADCVPILLYDPVEQVIAQAHGGWRGTARGIVAATVAAMHEQFGCLPRNILAGIGPAIGSCCYEVSETVRQLFLGQLQFDEQPTPERYRDLVHETAVFSTLSLPDRASLRLDLQATNRKQLLMVGVLPEHIEVMEICTSCSKDLFFSHRAEQGRTGRFPVLIALS